MLQTRSLLAAIRSHFVRKRSSSTTDTLSESTRLLDLNFENNVTQYFSVYLLHSPHFPTKQICYMFLRKKNELFIFFSNRWLLIIFESLLLNDSQVNSRERFYHNFCLKPLFYECWLWKLFLYAEFRKSFYHITTDIIIWNIQILFLVSFLNIISTACTPSSTSLFSIIKCNIVRCLSIIVKV